METKKNIFKRYKEEYIQANKTRKGEILDHVSDVTKMHRKACIRTFRALQCDNGTKENKSGRLRCYTKDVDAALYDLWEIADKCCGELLHPIINEYVSILIRDDMWSHGKETTEKLLKMSEHTVRRRVTTFRKKEGERKKGKSGTKPSHLKKIIPIFKGPWDTLPPGEGQIDTVAHCGVSLAGDFIWSVNYTDASTYWIVLCAQWNKGQEATIQSMKGIQKRLLVSLLHLHPDTGSEFINWNAKRWCDEENIRLTRSEPGKKNDNMYVEERNGHVVRKYLGYTRLDVKSLLPVLNKYYDVLALYLNHFKPVRRTIEKKRVGSQYRRKYESNPKTPYERMLAYGDVPNEVKERLREEHEKLNPLVLKRELAMVKKKIIRELKNGHGE